MQTLIKMKYNNDLFAEEKQLIDNSIAQDKGAEDNQSKSKSKSKRWNHPVRDKLEDVFCVSKSFVRPGIIYQEKDNKKVETARYSWGGKQFTENYIGKEIIVAIRPMDKIKVLILDIDINSRYRDDYSEVLDALEEIGLVRCLRVISSSSGGLHLYFPLERAIKSEFLYVSMKAWLQHRGLIVSPGHIEIFPSATSKWQLNDEGRKELVYLAQSIRLPLQSYEGKRPMSYVVDEDENYVHSDINQFWFDDFDYCANAQDYEEFKDFESSISLLSSNVKWDGDMLVLLDEDKLVDAREFELQPVVKKKVGRPSKVYTDKEALKEHLSGLNISRREYIKTLRELVKTGWTDSSQSNFLIGAVAILASYDNRHLEEADLAKSILWEVKRMPGYEQYTSDATKKDLSSAKRNSWARRWAKSVIKYRNKRMK